MATETFAQRLRRLRVARGLNPSLLAYAVGITESSIRQMEQGKHNGPGSTEVSQSPTLSA